MLKISLNAANVRNPMSAFKLSKHYLYGVMVMNVTQIQTMPKLSGKDDPRVFDCSQ